MTYDVETLYALLPPALRARDSAAGGPLKGLFAVLAEPVAALEDDLARSYDDLFVETCSDWVIPYIGDLVGTTPLFDSGRNVIDASAPAYAGLAGPRFVMVETLRSRADVAKTISYRRRKATRPMLEELARDVTGWAAHVVEMFQRIRWTQCVRNHLRPAALGFPDLRSVEALDRTNGPFDVTLHDVDVRRPSIPSVRQEGWYQVPSIAFFLWRLKSFPLADVPARPVSGPGDWRWHMSPLGNPAPLFARWRTEASGGAAFDPAGRAVPDEARLPGPIRRKALARDLREYAATTVPRAGASAYYGRFDDQAPEATSTAGETLPDAPYAAITIVRDGKTVPPDKVRCIRLASWCQPKGEVVGIDPERGRISFGDAFVPTSSVDVFFHHGLPGGIGGGSYPRLPWLVRRDPASTTIEYVVSARGRSPAPGATTYPTIQAALGKWVGDGRPHAIVVVNDSRTYAETLDVALPAGGSLVIEASDGVRPHLLLGAPLTVGGAPDASFTLSGVVVEGALHVNGPLGFLRLLHATLVPGGSLTVDGAPAGTQPSLVVDGTDAGGQVMNTGLEVAIVASITGPLRVPSDVSRLFLADAIVDGVGGAAIAGGTGSAVFAAPMHVERSTIFGPTSVRELTYASETIFAAPVTAQRRQTGCVRFSYVPLGSIAPRRYHCQPDMEIASRIDARKKELGTDVPAAERDAIRVEVAGWLVPSWVSRRYGDPSYAQLAAACPSQIAKGAQDGSEMGVWCQLKQPQREDNLRTRLGEYLPVGLQGVIVYVT